MSWVEKLLIIPKMIRLLFAPSSTLNSFKEAIRTTNKSAVEAFTIDISHGYNIISVSPDLKPYYNKFGKAFYALLWIKPFFISRIDYEDLIKQLINLRSIVRTGSLRIENLVGLDGGGSTYAGIFVNYLRESYPGRIFNTAFEWCSGPGYIGFSLLESGICKNLVLADINPDAIDCVKKTIAQNGLSDRVTCYVSPDVNFLKSVKQIDLVVGNPPWSYSQNDLHNHLIANDPGWRIHHDFYSSIGKYLVPKAVLCISAFKPFSKNSRLEPNFWKFWDKRPRPPHEDFCIMINKGGLNHVETIAPKGRRKSTMGYGLYFIVSSKP